MEKIRKVAEMTYNPAKKSHQLQYNDIYLVKDDQDNLYLDIFANGNTKCIRITYNNTEKMLNELKSCTWTVEPNGSTVKSCSYYNPTKGDVRLTQLVSEYNEEFEVFDLKENE